MRFICDVMLGKLARHLRLFGLDAVYVKTEDDLRDCLRREPDRILLTRRRRVDVSSPRIQIRSEIAREQLLEMAGVIKASVRKEQLFSRCIECNVELIHVDREEIEPLVPEFVYHHYSRFMICPSCKRVFWEGSHAKGMEELTKEILA